MRYCGRKRSRHRGRRWTLAVAGLLLLAGCAAPPRRIQPLPPSTLTDPPSVQPRRPAGPVTFSYSGARMQGGTVIGIAPTGTSLLTFDGVAVPVAPDGRFLIAFDRDAKPSVELVATLEDGRQVVDTLFVAPRAWDISRLDTLAKTPIPEADFARIRPSELAEIAAARRTQVVSDGWRQPFLWPITGRISTLFGSQRIYRNNEAGAYHSGLDIARPTGTPVLAPADGVVILAAGHVFTLEGNLLMIDHGMGLNSAFLHLSRIDVAVGARVRRGQVIGAVGMTGRATGPHLHWGMKWRASRIDPLLLTGPMPVGP